MWDQVRVDHAKEFCSALSTQDKLASQRHRGHHTGRLHPKADSEELDMEHNMSTYCVSSWTCQSAQLGVVRCQHECPDSTRSVVLLRTQRVQSSCFGLNAFSRPASDSTRAVVLLQTQRVQSSCFGLNAFSRPASDSTRSVVLLRTQRVQSSCFGLNAFSRPASDSTRSVVLLQTQRVQSSCFRLNVMEGKRLALTLTFHCSTSHRHASPCDIRALCIHPVPSSPP
ncbi:hypothetical protein KUCAC02_032525 [Chaenocephalus aceratus]|nr:hypothetical protein KUCAC02_032525 [Chaenocephalus aceratus]